MKAVVAAFNQEKALVGAFSVIVQPVVEPMEHYTALFRIHLCAESWHCPTQVDSLAVAGLDDGLAVGDIVHHLVHLPLGLAHRVVHSLAVLRTLLVAVSHQPGQGHC